MNQWEGVDLPLGSGNCLCDLASVAELAVVALFELVAGLGRC